MSVKILKYSKSILRYKIYLYFQTDNLTKDDTINKTFLDITKP